MAKTRKRTPKERVLARYPGAYAYQWAGPSGWYIYANDGLCLGGHEGAAAATIAWASAASRLKGRKPATRGRP